MNEYIDPYVYYDKRYPSHWIKPEVSEYMAGILRDMGFRVINADEAKKLMKNATKSSKEIVVVFSQDVIPEKLLDNPSSPTSNSLIRRFLNNGHSVIWLGDTPLLYVGFSNGEKRSLATAFIQKVLSLDPNIANAKIHVRHTLYGHLLQLPMWMGAKPHRGTGTVGFIPLSISIHGIHAFIASYYKAPTGHYAFSGLIRLYDMILDSQEKLNQNMIRGIVNAVFRNYVFHLWAELNETQKNLHELNEELKTSFNTVKSELDNLGKILDQILKLAKEKAESQRKENKKGNVNQVSKHHILEII